ncbi:MAG: NAD(P)-dependent oxidoreductase [Pseudomonadota bacterium]
MTKIGLSGTGFIARGMYGVIESTPDLSVSRILTRRPVAASAPTFPEEKLTNAVEDLVDGCDIVVECSGDALHAAHVLQAAGEAGRPAITMNSEAQVTIGSGLVRRGYQLTEAHGDQPGCLAELDAEAREMSFTPLAYVNLKGFLNENPTPEDMEYWGTKQGLSLQQVTSFTDGSKLQIEQVLVANGLGARLAKPGLIGGKVEDLRELDYLAEAARATGAAISDYVLNPGGPPGILLLCESAVADTAEGYMPLTRLKTKGDTAYVILRPHHLCHLEIVKTIRSVLRGDPPLLTNGTNPVALAAAIVKQPLGAGHVFAKAVGGFDIRASAFEFADAPDAVPANLLDGAQLKHAVEPGHVLTWADLDVPDSLALTLWLEGTREPMAAGRVA